MDQSADPATGPLRAEAARRTRLLARLGLGALSLGRGADTLSSGEARRLHLGAVVAGELSGVLYVVDEPTSGLGESDSAAVIAVLVELVEAGNTVIAVTHDAALVRRCAQVVDFGPGAGGQGGALTFVGSPEGLAQQDSASGRWLRAEVKAPSPGERAPSRRPPIQIEGVEGHGLSGLAAPAGPRS